MRPSIVLGPGARFQPLAGVLSGLGWSIRRIHDWADLVRLDLEGPLVVLIDAETTPLEDLGLVRRCIAANPTLFVTALGEDAGTRVARTLLAMPRVKWMGWPPDLDDILSLTALPTAQVAEDEAEREQDERARATDARRATRPATTPPIERTTARTSTTSSGPFANASPGSSRATRSERELGVRTAAPRTATRVEAEDEIARIQSILEGEVDDELDLDEPPRTAPPAKRSQSAPTTEARTDDTPTRNVAAASSAMSTSATSSIARAHESAPTWWRAQVADLADAAQRIELGAQAVRNETLSPDAADQVDVLEAEIARLVQFARTLGYVAAPPSRGEQVFDLAEMVQMFAHELANRTDAAPRCLFRAPAHVWVRSDRALLSQVFDALFWVAGACARAGELVRAQVQREGDVAEARIEFPNGPLEGFELERILEPYGLRRVLPDLGPNALSAAQGILAGQGGRAMLERTAPDRLEWRLELPAVEPPETEPAMSGGSGKSRKEPPAAQGRTERG